MEAIVITAITCLFAGGGLATIIKAVNDYKLKKRESEFSADRSLMSRQDKIILALQDEERSDDRYIRQLINTLIKAGVEVPERKD